MEGGRGARRAAALSSSSTGSSWASFEEKAKDYELKSGLLGPSRNPFSPTTRQLCREDMAIYGEEPASDSLALVVCEQCGRVVKSQALSKHKELYHSKVFHIPPPKHIGHSRIHTVGQPSVGGFTDEPRGQLPAPGSPKRRGSSSGGGGGGGGGGGVMGFAATELPRQNSSSSGIGGVGVGGLEDGNTGSTKSSKEYDPNRHCGVWVEDEQRHCTRSLTCKFHPLSQKGRVQGRSRPFAELLEDHRRRKKLKKQGKLGGGGGHTPSLTPSEPPPLTAHPLYPPPPHSDRLSPPALHPTSAAGPAPFPHLDEGERGGGREGERGGGEWVVRDDQSEEESNVRDLPSRPDYPKPLAVCSFGARATKCGSSVFGRRSDHLRSILASLSGRSKDFTETTLHRKHSYSSLLQQRRERRYFTHKDMFSQDLSPSSLLRPVVSPTADVRFAPPLTEYTTPLPPSSPPPTILPRPPTSHRPPTTTTTPAPPPGAEISTPLRNHIGDRPPTAVVHPPRVNGGEIPLDDVVSAAREGEEGEEGGGREGERRGKERRRKKGRGRRKRRRSGEGEGEHDPATEEPAHNHVPHPIPEATPVTMTTQVGVPNLPPAASRIVGDGGRGVESAPPPLQQTSSRRGGGGGEKGGRGGRGSLGDFRMIRIKQEPMDDEQDHQHKIQPSKPNSLLPNGIVTTPPPPPLASSASQSPIHSFNAANAAGRGAQSFVINPSGGRGHHMMTPHLGGLLPIRGSTLQHQQHQHQQQQQQQQQQQHQQPQGFTFGHSLQGLPVQMINDSLQRHMLQHGTLWLTPPQTHPQATPHVGGGGVVDPGVHRQQNLVAPSIIHSLGNSAPPGYPTSLTNQTRPHHAHLLSFQRANPAATSGRVRAPISPVPSGVPLHEALSQRLPHSAVAAATTPGALQPGVLFGGQSPVQLHGKQTSLATPPGSTPQLPSQRVT